jgi:hypothetical protein
VGGGGEYVYVVATGAPHHTLECCLVEAQSCSPAKKFARKIEKLEFSVRLPASAAVALSEASTELAAWRSRAASHPRDHSSTGKNTTSQTIPQP